MNPKDWLEQKNITRDTYYYWLRKCRATAAKGLPAEMEAQLPATDGAVTFKRLEIWNPLPNLQPAVISRPPNATLEVVNGAMQQTLDAVLPALRSTC